MELKDAIALYAAIVSTFAAVTSVGILTWQIASWRMDGPRVRVRAELDPPRYLWDTDRIFEDEACWTIKVEVFNEGRDAVEVTGVGLMWWRDHRYFRETRRFVPFDQFEESKRIEGGRGGFIHTIKLGSFDEFRYIADKVTLKPYAQTRGRKFVGNRMNDASAEFVDWVIGKLSRMLSRNKKGGEYGSQETSPPSSAQ